MNNANFDIACDSELLHQAQRRYTAWIAARASFLNAFRGTGNNQGKFIAV